MPKTVLALVPHPDDAEYHAGGLLAQFARQGAAVHLVIATDGSKGTYDMDPGELVSARREEARRGARALGALEPILLGHSDMELEQLPPAWLRAQFVRLIRQICPDTVVLEDPFAHGVIHPDHRAAAWAASEAVAFAGLPRVFPEHLAEGLRPHVVAEKYYYTDDPQRANRVIDISETLPVKLAALGEHTTQVAFLVQGLMIEAGLAGAQLPADFADDGQPDYQALMAWGLSYQAAEIGKPYGYPYGEAYRYERFHPIVEGLLALQASA